MRDYIRFSRSTLYILTSIVRLSWRSIAVLVSIAAIVAVVLMTWWYPFNYLIEGDQYHERKMLSCVHAIGYQDVEHVHVDIPRHHYRDFKCTCSALVSSDGGETYHEIAFNYIYTSKAWLNGGIRIIPTKSMLVEQAESEALGQYLQWSGKNCKELLANLYVDPSAAKPVVD